MSESELNALYELNERLASRGPYTEQEIAYLEKQVKAWIADHGVKSVITDFRLAVSERRRVRFGILNVMCVLAYVDYLQESLFTLREEERLRMLNPYVQERMTETNDSYDDGYHNAKAETIGEIDRILDETY